MWFLSVNTTHDASVVLIHNGEIVIHLKEERLRHIKHAYQIVWCFNEIKKYTSHIDIAAFTGLWGNCQLWDGVVSLLEFHGLTDKNTNYIHAEASHHVYHAFSGFFSSPFEEAICIVVDGAGADEDKEAFHKENETIYKLSRDKKTGYVQNEVLYRTVTGHTNIFVEKSDCYSRMGAGMAYNAIAEVLGWPAGGEGKVMGLASYAKSCSNIHELINFSWGASPFLHEISVNKKIGLVACALKPFKEIFKICPKNIEDKISEDFNIRSQLAKRIQDDYENYIVGMVNKALELSDCKNIIISGGCALNCVANYKVLKNLPEDVNLYIDPIADDSGIALGLASFIGTSTDKYVNFGDGEDEYENVHNQHASRKKYNPAYLGTKLEYNYSLSNNQTERDITAKEVAKLLESGNIVAIAQGRAETGARALGNRSILFDPRVENGKEIVNRVKKREWWRPFAGTVLLDHAREWFDMDRLEESPYMTFAIDVLPEKQKLIPSITHVDGTCRIQTVTQEQNKHYYDLISEFNNLTGVPILFNTSFNLAGDTIVDNMEDALRTLEESEIEYLYLPDIMKLIHVPNK